MSRRDGGSRRVEEYEERTYIDRDSPPPRARAAAPVRARDLLDVEIKQRRSSNARDRQPDFLRDDFDRNDQPLVLRRREVESFTRPVRRPPSPEERERVRTRVVEREQERTPSPVERERVRTRVVEREIERNPSPVESERLRTRGIERQRERSLSPIERERVRTKVVDRERRRSLSPVERERVHTRIVERQRERSLSPVERDRVRTRVVERERDRSLSPVERDRIRTRVVERERARSLSPVERDRVRTRVVERERERSLSPVERDRVSTRVVERERDRSYSPRGKRTHVRYTEKDVEWARPREPSLERTRTTTRIVERERERTPSPIRERETEVIRTRTVERERERARSVSSVSSVSEVEREPPIVRAPPIHQEIITHHRHIDHGYVYEPAPVPTPPPPARIRPRESPRDTPRESDTEIDIYKGRGETDIDIHMSRRRGGHEEVRERRPNRDRDYYDDDVLIERDRNHLHIRESHNDRRRSVSARRERIDDDGSDTGFYARKTTERTFIGEAFNEGPDDWAIVDVPSGTERVRMNDVGGDTQEITWQKHNGVRRSKFTVEKDSLTVYDREREEVGDRRIALPPPPRNKYGDMWTEITKDLVVREAIEQLGYDYEETEFFFYVIQYLSHDDVQEIVFLSDDIKRARRRRIKHMAHERDRVKEKEVLRIEDKPRYDDERIIEREVVYDSGPRRSRRY